MQWREQATQRENVGASDLNENIKFHALKMRHRRRLFYHIKMNVRHENQQGIALGIHFIVEI